MKQGSFLSFFLQLLVLSGVLYGAMYFLFTRVYIMPLMPTELMLLVLFGVTAGSHFIVMKAKEKSPQVFTRTYMGTSTGRLILYSIFMFIYCIIHKDIARVFVATFFVLYIIYTVFEVRSIRVFLKKK